MLSAKSLYRSRAGSHFHGTGYEIWADLGPVGNTEKKKFRADYEQLLRPVFHVFMGKKKCYNVFKNIVVSALESCIISLLYFFLSFFEFFFGKK